jgi:DNA-binding transcriptional MerR regulator
MTSPLRIGKAATLLGVSRKTLRHYEKRGLIMPSRAENGYRGYHPEHIVQLQRIRQLQSLGLALAQIKRVLRAPGNHQVWSDVLEALHTEITAKIVELEARRKRISAHRRHWAHCWCRHALVGGRHPRMSLCPGTRDYPDTAATRQRPEPGF